MELSNQNTVKRLRLRLQIGLNLTQVSVSGWLFISYKLDQVQQLKIYESIFGIATTLTNQKY